jgi:hypothetical protein
MALRLNDELTFHSTVTESATVATVERVGSCSVRDKLHYRGSSLLKFETIFLRAENKPGFTFGVRTVGVRIDLEAVSPIE